MTHQIDPSKDLTEFLAAHAEEIEAQEKNLVQREPSLIAGAVSGPVLGLVTWLGVGDPEKTSHWVVGLIVTVGVFLTNWVLRQYVAPEWKRLTGRELPSEVTDDIDDEPETATFTVEAHDPGSSEQLRRLAGHPSPRARQSHG